MINKKNLHLLISSIIITAVALVYGFFPNKILPKLFDFTVESVDLKHVFRAMMGLYLGMVAFWVIGIMKPHHWQSATISCVLFMFGLASGRIISLLLDGIPSGFFCAGLALELALALWGVKNLNKYKAVQG